MLVSIVSCFRHLVCLVFWVRSRPRFLHSDLLSSCDVILILHSDWLSGLEKEDSMFEMALNSFVISKINLYQLFEGIHLKININPG